MPQHMQFRLCRIGKKLKQFNSFGAPRIELGQLAPKASVLPVYYAPFLSNNYNIFTKQREIAPIKDIVLQSSNYVLYVYVLYVQMPSHHKFPT